MEPMYYFGTNLSMAGHYFYIIRSGLIDLSYRVMFDMLPFNPERFPIKENGKELPNGEVRFYKKDEWLICAIQGSCRDHRPGSKSIFFTKRILVPVEFMNELLREDNISSRIIKQMPFEVKWPADIVHFHKYQILTDADKIK